MQIFFSQLGIIYQTVVPYLNTYLNPGKLGSSILVHFLLWKWGWSRHNGVKIFHEFLNFFVKFSILNSKKMHNRGSPPKCCKYLNARYECNDIIIFIYSHYPLDPNSKLFDNKCFTLSFRWFYIRIEKGGIKVKIFVITL